MIPVKLTLKNFLSYGEDVPPLDFEQFHIACLSGDNGQGKSALLDAITWVVWGEGRKSSREKKADSSLLRIGQTDMRVEFVFDLEGSRYRIIRTFYKGGKNSRSGLEFQVLNPEINQYIPLSAASIRKTQEKINDILRIDYPTFINSAFILQGRIDEFSRKNARERKEILSEILNLSRYDQLANLAKMHLKEMNHNIIGLEGRLLVIDEELKNSDSYKAQVKELSDRYKVLKAKISKRQKEISAVKDKLNILKHKQEQLIDLQNRTKQIQQEIEQEKEDMNFKNDEIQYCKKIIDQKETILRAYQNYLAFTEERDKLVKELQKIRKLEREKVFTEKKLEIKKTNLTIALNNHQTKQSELQQIAKGSEKFKRDILELEEKLEKFRLLEKEKEKIREKGMQLKLELERLKDKQERLEKTMTDEQEKLRMLSENSQGKCPLCDSRLNADKKNKIKENIYQEINRLDREIKRILKEEKEKSLEKDKLSILWTNTEKKIKNKGNFLEVLSQAKERNRQAEQAKDDLNRVAKAIRQIQEKIDNKKYAEEEFEELKRLTDIMKHTIYREERHQWLDKKIKSLQLATSDFAKLEDAEKKINHLLQAVKTSHKKLTLKRADLLNMEKRKEVISKELQKMPELEELIITKEEELKLDLEKSNLLLEEKGGYQGKYEYCLQLGKERKDLTRDLRAFRKKQGIYEKLITAFGKNGIQALIIENVLPEIEEEANDILSRLTNHRTQVSIKSLRDLKSGKVKETLDIEISDELGIRDYELYSGGESFRIDFALRIALSKLLTRRAGAKLRTLVMDEGFGTQDEEGIENLVQAIGSISEDFDKILVITHLESLKTAFPVRIEVVKLPEIGSRYEIIKN